MNEGVDYEEVARIPDRVDGGELVRWIGSSEDIPHWRWWALSGDRGGVTFVEMPDSAFGGDFGIHFPGDDEGCPLIGRCRFRPWGPDGAVIAAQIRDQDAERDELVKMAIVWDMLTSLYYGHLEPTG